MSIYQKDYSKEAYQDEKINRNEGNYTEDYTSTYNGGMCLKTNYYIVDGT